MASAVLDSSAVLAVLNAEPGADVVIATLDDALLSTVNYAEVVTKIVWYYLHERIWAVVPWGRRQFNRVA